MPGRSLHPSTDRPAQPIFAAHVAPSFVEKRLDERLAQKRLRSGISHAGGNSSAIDRLRIAQYVRRDSKRYRPPSQLLISLLPVSCAASRLDGALVTDVTTRGGYAR